MHLHLCDIWSVVHFVICLPMTTNEKNSLSVFLLCLLCINTEYQNAEGCSPPQRLLVPFSFKLRSNVQHDFLVHFFPWWLIVFEIFCSYWEHFADHNEHHCQNGGMLVGMNHVKNDQNSTCFAIDNESKLFEMELIRSENVHWWTLDCWCERVITQKCAEYHLNVSEFFSFAVILISFHCAILTVWFISLVQSNKWLIRYQYDNRSCVYSEILKYGCRSEY